MCAQGCSKLTRTTCAHVYVYTYMYTSTTRQAGRAAIGPQTRASGASEHSNPCNDFPLPSNVQISVGDSGYSRQVDTEPVGIDIGAFSIHTVSDMQYIRAFYNCQLIQTDIKHCGASVIVADC